MDRLRNELYDIEHLDHDGDIHNPNVAIDLNPGVNADVGSLSIDGTNVIDKDRNVSCGNVTLGNGKSLVCNGNVTSSGNLYANNIFGWSNHDIDIHNSVNMNGNVISCSSISPGAELVISGDLRLNTSSRVLKTNNIDSSTINTDIACHESLAVDYGKALKTNSIQASDPLYPLNVDENLIVTGARYIQNQQQYFYVGTNPLDKKYFHVYVAGPSTGDFYIVPLKDDKTGNSGFRLKRNASGTDINECQLNSALRLGGNREETGPCLKFNCTSTQLITDDGTNSGTVSHWLMTHDNVSFTDGYIPIFVNPHTSIGGSSTPEFLTFTNPINISSGYITFSTTNVVPASGANISYSLTNFTVTSNAYYEIHFSCNVRSTGSSRRRVYCYLTDGVTSLALAEEQILNAESSTDFANMCLCTIVELQTGKNYRFDFGQQSSVASDITIDSDSHGYFKRMT